MVTTSVIVDMSSISDLCVNNRGFGKGVVYTFATPFAALLLFIHKSEIEDISTITDVVTM
jgi:hypothetical protein